MLVEDDNNLREIYEARLQAEGYTIVSAHDGEEALVIAKAEKPDLVISDVMMPKISGFEMLDIMRNTDGLRDVKVIMLTALGQSDDQQRANKLGADRYLVKSQVTLEDIVKAAHDLLGEAGALDTPAPAAAAPTEPAAAPVAAPAAPEAPAPTIPPEPQPVATASVPVSEPPTAPAPAPATAPVVAPPAAATPTSAPPITDTPAPATDDDKVMADAVDKLIADTDKKPDPQPEASEDTTEPAEEPAAPETPAETKEDDDPQNGHVTIANKKVITPIDTTSEKDLDTLLAEEEAKEASSAAGATIQPAPDADASSEKAAPSTAQEEASMDAKIEDFVAGATSEPDAPIAMPPTDSTTPSEADPTPGTPAAAPQPEPAPAEPAPQPAPAQPVIKPIVVSEPAAAAPPTPGVPASSPETGSDTTPPDPNTIAL
jgi:CheY-like chemotaxis protein